VYDVGVRLVSLIVCFFAACTRPPPPSASRDPNAPDLSLEQVTLRSYSGGALRVITTADRLDAYREVGTPGDLRALDAGVTIVRDGTLLRAPVVTGNFLSGQLAGTGGVTMVGKGDVHAKSDSVFFDRNQGAGGVASSDAGLVFDQPGAKLTASGFVADLADEHVSFTDAKTELSPR
jgi:hypothetical protein